MEKLFGEKMTKDITLNFYVVSYNRGGRDPEDTWSRDSYEYSWDFLGIQFGKYGHSTTIDNYQPDQKIYVIYVIYSTGDSFGFDINSDCEVIGATHNRDLANKISAFIEQDNKDRSTRHCNTMHDIEGIKFYTYPWKGYFESFSGVYVEECQPLG